MKATRILAISFTVLVMLSGCGKDKADHISIVAERMGIGGGGKVWVDPDHVNNATWVAGESIDLNGTPITIQGNGNGSFSLNVHPLDVRMYAIYPATTTSSGNDIEVRRHSDANDTVLLRSLVVNFLSSGGHEVVFPMESQAEAGAGSMRFNHLTAGLRLTLQNNTGTDNPISAVKVVVRSDAAAAALDTNGVVATWAVQGPTMPGGAVGRISGDRPVGYASEMYFVLKTDGSDYATVGRNGGTLSFCVPLTVSKFRYITVTGYNANGSQRFTRTKDLGQDTEIKRNIMYNIPTINYSSGK